MEPCLLNQLQKTRAHKEYAFGYSSIRMCMYELLECSSDTLIDLSRFNFLEEYLYGYNRAQLSIVGAKKGKCWSIVQKHSIISSRDPIL